MKIYKAILCVLIVSLLVSMALPMGSAKKPPKPPPDDPTPADPAIAYIGGSRDDAGLWVMDADGSHQTHVPLPDGIYPWYMSWSPDGTSIAFATWPVNTVLMHLWCIDIEVDEEGKVQGSNARELVHDIRPGYPAWSPNGDVIAYTKAENYLEDPPYSIYLYDMTDETSEVIYTDIDDVIEYLTWDPTGTELAFVQDVHSSDTTGKEPKIMILDVDLGTAREVWTLTTPIYTNYYSGGLDWARSDDKIAFRVDGEIAILDLSEEDYVTINSGAAHYFTWSPDDSKIAYQTFTYKGKRRTDVINTIDVATGDIETLAKGSYPEWSRA